jgi:hypothetical protein
MDSGHTQVLQSPTDLGRVAYAAYGRSTNYLNVRGEDMPAWGDLGERVQTAWISAASAVAQRVR